jgi:hypothetical protein
MSLCLYDTTIERKCTHDGDQSLALFWNIKNIEFIIIQW